MAVYVIKDDYDIHSIHLTMDEATAYLADLKKVSPQDDWEIEQLCVGRKEGHDKPIWGIEGVYDLLNGRVESVYRNWVWESQCRLPDLPRIGTKVDSQFVVIWLADINDNEYMNQVKKHYKGITINEEWIVQDANNR